MKRAVLFILLAALAPVRAAERLNFVFILIDDMGLTDVGCYGSKFYETPQIDRLARDGVKFTAAYSAGTVCSPTRAALLTGKYLPHFAVHQPIAGKKEVIAKYRAKRDGSAPQKNAVYAALVESVDDSVGRIRAKLDELKIADRTVIVFTSDNGGLIGPTANLGLRAGKGSAYEGGVRVPALALVPGVTKAGTECATPAITHDWFSTILELAGVAAPAAADGISLAPLLRGGELGARPLFWHHPHYHPGGATPYSSVRDGGWKLLHFYEDDRVQLYDLAADPAEQHDLATTNAPKTAELRAQLDAWRKAVDAQTPTPNPQAQP